MTPDPRFLSERVLVDALVRFNMIRHADTAEAQQARPGLERALELLFGASRRLAAYGSLAPGKENHRMIAHLSGTWRAGTVHGDLEPVGWAATAGFPALRWRPEGPEVVVRLFESNALPAEWTGLDEFEGADYRRILVPVRDEAGVTLVANLYELNPQSRPGGPPGLRAR